jgi:probable phosphoglycerate mutase
MPSHLQIQAYRTLPSQQHHSESIYNLTMRTLYIVTHPEATHHTSGLVGGWYNSELTARGLRAADRIAKALRQAISIDTPAANIEIWSSDLTRTKQTADAIAEAFGVETRYDNRLREKSYGEAEGKPQSWLRERFSPPPANGDRLNHHEGLDGAEMKAEWSARIYAATNDILRSHSKNQIVVTHGGSLTFIIAAWIKMPLESVAYVNFGAQPGSITVLKEDDYWYNRAVTTLCDVKHLED